MSFLSNNTLKELEQKVDQAPLLGADNEAQNDDPAFASNDKDNHLQVNRLTAHISSGSLHSPVFGLGTGKLF